MELSIARNELMVALSRVQGVADRRSSLPVLSNVLFESEGPGGLRMSATDLHVGITGVVPARIEKGGTTTVSARTLYDIVRNLPEGEVQVKVDANHWMDLRAGRVHYRIAGIPAEDFPSLPSAEEVEFFTIGSGTLGELIGSTHFAISPDETRPHLNGALFEGEGKVLRMVATDGHRLSMVEHTVDQGKGLFGFSMLLPQKAILELKRLVEEGPGEIEVGAAAPNAFFRRQLPRGSEEPDLEVTMSVKLVEASFPPYRQVIPKASERQVGLSRQGLLEALRRVSLISRERTIGVRLNLTSGKLTIVSDNPEVGEATEEMDASYDGDALGVGFNARYLIDVLQAVQGNEVRLGLGGPLDPGVITPAEGKGFLAVVMPMRI